jgi:hypothetical protein
VASGGRGCQKKSTVLAGDHFSKPLSTSAKNISGGGIFTEFTFKCMAEASRIFFRFIASWNLVPFLLVTTP